MYDQHTFSSIVPVVRNLYTYTLFFCPSLHTRAAAWIWAKLSSTLWDFVSRYAWIHHHHRQSKKSRKTWSQAPAGSELQGSHQPVYLWQDSNQDQTAPVDFLQSSLTHNLQLCYSARKQTHSAQERNLINFTVPPFWPYNRKAIHHWTDNMTTEIQRNP